MGYDSEKIEVKDVASGYNHLGADYAQYHQWLDDFDHAERRRFLPRSLTNLRILDLGAGDGRTFSWFQGTGYKQYVACDISEALLALHPQDKVETVIADLEDDLPFEDGSFDIVTSFFVLEHIHRLEELFREVYRILSGEGRWILTMFPLRREFVHQGGRQKFKIVSYPYGYDIIEKLAELVGFTLYPLEIVDHKKHMVGKAYCLERD